MQRDAVRREENLGWQALMVVQQQEKACETAMSFVSFPFY